jgi:hypothetical protein
MQEDNATRRLGGLGERLRGWLLFAVALGLALMVGYAVVSTISSHDAPRQTSGIGYLN